MQIMKVSFQKVIYFFCISEDVTDVNMAILATKSF